MREVSVESEEEGGEREVTGAVHGGRRKMRKRRLGFWVLEQCRVQRGTKPKQTKPDQATTNHSDFVDLLLLRRMPAQIPGPDLLFSGSGQIIF